MLFSARHILGTGITLALLSAPARAAPDDEACPAGKVRNEDTAGHCCWEGQAWSGLYKQCVGLAECPAGYVPTEDGEDCETLECEPDQIEMGDGCCWPGQRWVDDRCVGERLCSGGAVLIDGDCVEPPALPPVDPLPFVPITEADVVQLDPAVYTRGSPRNEAGRYRNERSHLVTLTRPVLVKRTEVTRREWRMAAGYDPSRFAACGDDCPVERVSWYDALQWLNRLSRLDGLPECYLLDDCTGDIDAGCPSDADALRCGGTSSCRAVRFVGLECTGYRLPTEAEWEYAARGGTKTPTHGGKPFREGRRDRALDAIARYAANSAVGYAGGVDCAVWTGTADGRCGPGPVGGLRANAFHLFDTMGNVAEWVWDGYGRYPRHGAADPVHHVGLDRVVRGGSWADGADAVRAALRSRMPPIGRNATVGFRWARTLPPGAPPAMLRRPLYQSRGWVMVEPGARGVGGAAVEGGRAGPRRPVVGDTEPPSEDAPAGHTTPTIDEDAPPPAGVRLPVRP